MVSWTQKPPCPTLLLLLCRSSHTLQPRPPQTPASHAGRVALPWTSTALSRGHRWALHTCFYLQYIITTLTMSDKIDLQKHSDRVTESVTCAVQGEMTSVAALFSHRCFLIGVSICVRSSLWSVWVYFRLSECPWIHLNWISFLKMK